LSRTTSNCFHNVTDTTNTGNGWAASVCAFKDLLSTDIGRARDFAGEMALDGTITNYADSSRVQDSALFQPPRNLSRPYSTRNYAIVAEPYWSYFLPETAGTDKYGFSIRPAGLRSRFMQTNMFYYRGEFAGFWTSSQRGNSLNPAYVGTTRLAYVVAFRYNYRHNADFNSGIMSWAWDKHFGLSVRCIRKPN
jgi:hypothetical protein